MDEATYDKIHREVVARAKLHGFHCIGLEFLREDEQNILRLYIENAVGVDLVSCEAVSRDVSQYLDTIEDLLPSHYLLEVTSPGLERPLFCKQDFINNIGHFVQFTLVTDRAIIGKIVDASSSLVKVNADFEIFEFSYDDIKSAHLIFTLDKGKKKTFKKCNNKKTKERKHK